MLRLRENIEPEDVVLYTCLIGTRDSPKSVQFNDRIARVMFTDSRSALAKDWQLSPLRWTHSHDIVRTARYHKHHPHVLFPKAKASIWLDATHYPITDLMPILNHLGTHDIAAMRHPCRKTLKDEFETCISHNTDRASIMAMQGQRYFEEGYPDDKGLYSTSCLVRRHTPEMIRLQELWWKEIAMGSRRDQLSFTYCLWMLKMECGLIPGLCRGGHNPYFKMKSHYKRPVLRFL